MAVIPLSKAIQKRDLFELAYDTLASGKSYTIETGGSKRTLTRQDAEWVKKEWLYWLNYVSDLEAGRSPGSLKTKLIRPLY